MILNAILKEFNRTKLEDLDLIEKILTSTPPKFGASVNELIEENDIKMNLCKSFIYYYRLLELSIINLKKYKNDKDTLENINEMITEYYKQYNKLLEELKKIKGE